MNKTFLAIFIGGLILVGGIMAWNVTQGRDAVPLSKIFSENEKPPADVAYEYVDTDSLPNGQGASKMALEVKSPTPATSSNDSTLTAQSKPTQTSSPQVTTALKIEPKPSQNLGATDLNGVPFTIQVSSFKEKSKAEKVLDELKTKGYSAYIISHNLGEKGLWYRIYVGRFVQKQEAEELLSKIKQDYRDSFIIIPKIAPQ